MDNENGYISDNGGDRIGGGSGSVGSDTGSAGNGSDRDANGSGRDADGSGRSADGNGSDAGNIVNGNFGSNATGENGNDVGNNVEPIDRDSDALRNSRADRDRGRRPIRLGRFGNRDTDTADGNDGSADTDQRVLEEPVIRLGARGRGRPKAKVENESGANEFKLSETKALISVFIGSLFEIPAIMLRQDFWRLSNEENKALTDAIMEYLKSMPKSKSSRVAQFISEHLPIVNLGMIALFIIGDRVQGSIAVAQVTKAGRAYNIGDEPKPTQSGETIRTPMDAIFS